MFTVASDGNKMIEIICKPLLAASVTLSASYVVIKSHALSNADSNSNEDTLLTAIGWKLKYNFLIQWQFIRSSSAYLNSRYVRSRKQSISAQSVSHLST